MRRVVGLTVACALLLIPPARAAEGDRSGDVAAAQKRANAAAARLAAAQSELAKVEREVADLERRTAQARSEVDVLAARVRDMAVRQYVNNGSARSITAGDLSAHARGQAMLRIVTLGNTDDLEAYRVARDDMQAGQAALRKRLEERKSAAASLRADSAKAVAELDKLAAAQRAYEAKQAAERKAAEERSRQQSASRRATPVRSTPSMVASGSWVCPVQGPRSFSNDWGQPRSGGRRHQGTDILAPRGTPVVANVSGTVRGHNSSLGGISYYLQGDDGNVYFGTHLDSLAGVSGRVSAGTVIGRVGTSGNASGGPPHLHFEIHPGGGGPVNPYPTLAKYC
ncbi:MAG: peptidoglycan DD-metalloendopeptidase family protein [Actinobacteria bacterium]|nr:peptidoglycan DD-metalloendopeptidase family protein [Actinomycetota bacterium]